MVGLKSITDLPMAENTNGANLIVNDNGVAKQASLDSIRTEQEYDLVFRMNESLLYGGAGYIDYLERGSIEPVSQEQLNMFWNKVKKGDRVRVLLDSKNAGSYGTNSWYNCGSWPMSFSGSWSPDHIWGQALTLAAGDEEGTFAQLIQIHIDDKGITHAAGTVIAG